MMINIALFLGSCALIAAFAWYFCQLGKSALIAWITMISLLANLFVLKQISLLGFNATASDTFAVGSLLGLNLLQEKYGREAAQSAIWISFSCLLFFILVSQIHLVYIPSAYDHMQSAYSSILSPAPRILLASLATFFVVDQFDSALYHLLRKKIPQWSRWWVSGITLSLSQGLDTVLFSVLGLYGMVDAIIEIMMVSFAIKLLVIANTVPWSYITQKYFIKRDHIPS